MKVVAAPELLALHGADVAAGADVVVAMGDDGTEPSPDVIWRATPGDASQGVRTIAPDGHGLWRRAPLPAADALFALPPPPAGAPVLVAGGEAAARDETLSALAAAHVPARGAALPSPADLAAAAVVAVVGTPGAPLAPLVPPVLAAGRVLVAPRAAPGFGVAPGVDHLAYGSADERLRMAVAAARHPDAFAPLGVLGRLAAEAHRASVVLARIAADLR